ncbi:endolytic transglycosylase MltG [Bacillus sp. FJAT-49736]|uniref:endolytic transglycosylase MltG n=1 Tax=Bacillus sp. FJAT-49736 TaxID=2833582 RepID=UPI001BCA4244|nr:endolytic transglycosylase MltG [Bacillus sp. FJAT-49736]MBS4173542.1 endolytic transglycosylase MltG [Bacillus sp. FJAT-49736]
MDKRTTRAFASGLLLSALLLMGYNHFYGVNEPTNIKKGYTSIKTSQLQRLEKDAEAWKKKYDESQKENNHPVQKSQPVKETIIKYHLSITSGMTPEKIGSRLKTGGIIKDKKKFVQYLIDHRYHNKIQIGEYELTNKMSFAEIAKTITKGK